MDAMVIYFFCPVMVLDNNYDIFQWFPKLIHYSNRSSLSSLLPFIPPSHIFQVEYLQTHFLVWAWPFHFLYLTLSGVVHNTSGLLPYLAVFASATYDWAGNAGYFQGLLQEQALNKDVMTRHIPQGVISSGLCAHSRDGTGLQIPVNVVTLLLLPRTKIKFKIAAPSGSTWKTFPIIWWRERGS